MNKPDLIECLIVLIMLISVAGIFVCGVWLGMIFAIEELTANFWGMAW